MPIHTEPIPAFWSEWWAGALGLAAAVLGLSGARDRLPLTSLLLVPALLLTALLLQFALGRLVFPQVALLYALYLLWAGLLVVLGRHLADTLGLARLADVLALTILLGAVIGAVIALAQWLGFAQRVPWIFPNLDGSIYANLGQANHHAHYSWLGIASVFYLRGQRRVSRGTFWLLILLLGFGSVLSGARSVFLYPLLLLAILLWARHKKMQRLAVGMVADAVMLVPALLVLNLFGTWASPRVPEFWVWLGRLLSSPDIGGMAVKAGGSVMAGARLYESVSGFSPRLAITRTAWAAFADQPWQGQGAGNYAWASFIAAAEGAGDQRLMVAEHAHSLPLHLFAEFGVPVALAVLVLLALWAKQFLRQSWRLEHVWCACVLGMGAVHSMLEYPLWYAYFLGPAALLLGATDSGKAITLAGRRVTVYLFLAALMGSLILANLRSDYSGVEAASNYPLAVHPDRERAWRISMDRLLVLQRESLLSPWVLMAFTNLSQPSRQLAQDRADLCERGIRFAPARSLVTRCAMQFAIAGRASTAQGLALGALRAFPAERAATLDELAKGAAVFPEVVPLWQAGLGN